MKAIYAALVLLVVAASLAAGSGGTIDLSEYGASIRYDGSTSIKTSPTEASPGTGYYSDNPLGYGILAGGRTSIKNSNSAMNREIDYAHALEGGLDVSASESSLKTESGVWGESTIQMNVDETITDGTVHIGALQGGEGSTAWKDPVIEVDEVYVGTYHIMKNMTIEVPYGRTLATPEWLPCCYTIPGPRMISAEEIFGAA